MVMQNFFRLSPGFCFSDGLASLALIRQGMKDKSSRGVFDWNVTGASICYLGLEVRLFPVFRLVYSCFLENLRNGSLSVNDFIFWNIVVAFMLLLLFRHGIYTKL